jgi:hypothetical protein
MSMIHPQRGGGQVGGILLICINYAGGFSLLSPFIPLSNRNIFVLVLSLVCEGEEILRGGFTPSLIHSPLQPV